MNSRQSIVAAILLGAAVVAQAAKPLASSTTVLGIQGTAFTLNGKPAFLLGFSYYGALGAQPVLVGRDLDSAQRLGFNWLRVWATWNAFEQNLSAVGADGAPREPYLENLKRLVSECDRRGFVVDVTLTRGEMLSNFAAHQRAVETLVGALKAHRNWYLDLANEHDVRDARYVSDTELKLLRDRVRHLDSARLVTASFGGHDLTASEVRASLLTIRLDFLTPHRPRTAQSPPETESQTRALQSLMHQLGCAAPIQYQEPFRRGYSSWEPQAEDFLNDLKGAVSGGAAGWCFHNGQQGDTPDKQPGRSFDLRKRPLFEQLDDVEQKVVQQAAAEIRGWHDNAIFVDDPVVNVALNKRSSTTTSTGEALEPYYPPPESAGGWRKFEKPDEIRRLGGVDPAKLSQLKEWLLQSDERHFAAVVIRHGYIVLEVERGNSAKTDSRSVASVSKAVCATVLAIASEQSQHGLTPRKMTFDDPAFDFIPWAQPLSDPRKARITIKQLLNHTSGICPEANGAPNDGSWEYILGHTGDERTARLAFDPGTGCGYSTHALAHAALVCETVTGMQYDQFAIQALFKPLGIEHWWFQFYEGKIGRHPSHGLGMPARDLARIALCMLHEGRWKDQQVIPRWFVDQTGNPSSDVKTPELRWKLNPQVFSLGWELPARHWPESGRSGQGIPADAREKPGSGGQLIAFVPSLDLVITRQTGSSGDWAFEEYLRRACAAVMTTR